MALGVGDAANFALIRYARARQRQVLEKYRDSDLVAFDFDERDPGVLEMLRQAVIGARRNGRLNGVERRIEHVCGVLDDVPTATFDVVLANLYGFLLVGLAPALVARCKPGAAILLSGMLWEYDWEVRSRFVELGCTELSHRMMAEFSAVRLEAPQ